MSISTPIYSCQLALGRDAAVRLLFGNCARSGAANAQFLKEVVIDFLESQSR
jgi:hypothetical protein